MKNNPFAGCRTKVKTIFEELVGARAEALDPTKHNRIVQEKIQAAFKEDLGEEKARLLGFHMADWNADAAFIVALHLFPKKFTKREITAGIISFHIGATDHITAASTINGFHIEDPFEVGIFRKTAKQNQKIATEPGVVADLSRLQERLPSQGKGKKPVTRRRASAPGS